jgi:hypothetical protein
VSGFVNKAANFADSFVFSKLFETGKYTTITTITDDEKFAKKRLVNPKTVYSGLIDIMTYAEVSASAEENTIKNAIAGKDAWLAFNVSSADLQTYADLAAKGGLKRVVFGVPVSGEESGADVTYESARSTLEAANVAFTIVKYGTVTKMGEAKFPYRIVRGALPIPTEGPVLSSDDLMRVSLAVCQRIFNSPLFLDVQNILWPSRFPVIFGVFIRF